MPRIIAAILLVAVLAIGGGIIATTAYQAGLSTAVTTATASGGTVVAPVAVPAYGYGWHPFGFGFGIFGFFVTLFFLFVIFGLLRAIFWRGGPGRRGGWGGHGYYGHDGPGYGKDADGQGRSPWESRAHDTFDDWHRRAHDAPAGGPGNGPTPPATPAPPAAPAGPA